MEEGLLEKYREKLYAWIDEHILLIGLLTSAISYGLIGNFIVHTRSWLTNPLKLTGGIVGVFFGFYDTMLCIRGIHLETDSGEEYSLVQEIATAVLLLPVYFVWVPVHLFKDMVRGESQ
ncbi:hypothetical protein [Haloplanus natans]|uniref:hypothetical protein n=1 Tax=Haloplanus natans TaxID=376171 RepID=UPI000677B687|nr:hypothetical protein [Haloplanus natans]